MSCSDDCASGIHDMCSRCECECHGHTFTEAEVAALWRMLSNQYIPYDDKNAHKVVKRVWDIINAKP